jgi:hypothetical protein
LPGPQPNQFNFTEENIAAVLLRTEMGENLTNIMRDYHCSHGRWLDRCREDPELASRFTQAKQYHADAYAEASIDILEAEPRLTVVINSSNQPVSERIDTGYVAWAKARFEGRLRLLAHWAKDRYGDHRQQLDIGSAPGRALQVEDRRDPASMVLAIAAALRAKKRDGDPAEVDEADIEDLI